MKAATTEREHLRFTSTADGTEAQDLLPQRPAAGRSYRSRSARSAVPIGDGLDVDPAGGAALAAQGERHAWAPLATKMRIYARMNTRRDYARGNGAMVGALFGSGLANGGYLLLLEALGRVGSSLPVVGVLAVGGLQMTLMAGSLLLANHARDNEDLHQNCPPEKVDSLRALCRGILWCAAFDGLQNIFLVGAAMGLSSGWLRPESALAAAVVARSTEGFIAGIAQGYWNCVKVRIDGPDAQGEHRALSRSVVGIENILHALAYTAASLLAFVVGRVGASTIRVLAHRSAMCAGAGLGMATAARTVFAGMGAALVPPEAATAPVRDI